MVFVRQPNFPEFPPFISRETFFFFFFFKWTMFRHVLSQMRHVRTPFFLSSSAGDARLPAAQIRSRVITAIKSTTPEIFFLARLQHSNVSAELYSPSRNVRHV